MSLNDFYAQNDINFYDANACGTGAQATLPGDDNASAIFTFLISTNFKHLDGRPMNAVQAAGFLANVWAESRFNPSAIQSGKAYNQAKAMSNVGGYAFGIVQWDGGRRVALLKYASRHGQDWRNLATQLEYLKTELDGAERGIMRDTTFRTTTDPGEAARRVNIVFERSGNAYNDTARPKKANELYEQLGGLSATNIDCLGGSNSEAFGTIAEVATTMAGWGGTYRWGGGHSSLTDLKRRIDVKFQGGNQFICHGGNCPPKSNANGVDCTGFVRAVVYVATGTDPGPGMEGKPKLYQRITAEEAQPGDLFVIPGKHVGVILENYVTTVNKGTKVRRFKTAEAKGTRTGIVLSSQYASGKRVFRYIGPGREGAVSTGGTTSRGGMQWRID